MELTLGGDSNSNRIKGKLERLKMQSTDLDGLDRNVEKSHSTLTAIEFREIWGFIIHLSKLELSW